MPIHLTSKGKLIGLIKNIAPLDDLERHQIQETIYWIESGESIYRLQKPDIPPKHLVVSLIAYDPKFNKILLVDHKNERMWLPAGGHVEVDETPHDAIKRECMEELGTELSFIHKIPILLTIGVSGSHLDVNLWYLLQGDSQTYYDFDRRELNDVRWFGFDEIPYDTAEPNLKRLISKLKELTTPSQS